MSSITSLLKNFFGIKGYKDITEDQDVQKDEQKTTQDRVEKGQNGLKVNFCPIVNPIYKPSVKIAYTLKDLLSNLTTELDLTEVFERNSYMLTKSEDGLSYSGVLDAPQGLLAKEFHKYLKKDAEQGVKTTNKFNFLILTEIVTKLQDPQRRRLVFKYLISELFDKNKVEGFIKLKNSDLVEDMKDDEVDDSMITELLNKAKQDVNIWSECLAPIYDRQFINSEDFKELKKQNLFVACLLSIL